MHSRQNIILYIMSTESKYKIFLCTIKRNLYATFLQKIELKKKTGTKLDIRNV